MPRNRKKNIKNNRRNALPKNEGSSERTSQTGDMISNMALAALPELLELQSLNSLPDRSSEVHYERELNNMFTLNRFRDSGTSHAMRSVMFKKFLYNNSKLPIKILIIEDGGSTGASIIESLNNSASREAYAVYAFSQPGSSTEHLSLLDSFKLTDLVSALKDCEIIFLCVKPVMAIEVLSSFLKLKKQQLEQKLLVSVVNDVHLIDIKNICPGIPTARALPNQFSTVHHSTTALFCGEVSNKPFRKLIGILHEQGQIQEIDEKLFPVFSAISNTCALLSYAFMEEMVEIITKQDIPRKVGVSLTSECLKGAAALLLTKEVEPNLLRSKFESPGGITIVGSVELTRANVSIMLDSVVDTMIEKSLDNTEANDKLFRMSKQN